MYSKRRKMNVAKRRSVRELPDEMLTEILVKLPMKSLMSSSCVCKTWRDLIIGNPYFSEKHSKSKKNKNEDIMVFAECWEDFNKEDENGYLLITNLFSRALVPFHIQSFGALAGSCNGIVCLAPRALNAALYNPITREHRILPPGLLGDDDFKYMYGKELLGFGFDKSTDDYKVVRIRFDALKTKRYAEIYRLSTNCWRKLEFQNLPLLDHFSCYVQSPNGVFLNGIVHWVVIPYFKIFTFDFEAEKFGEMECVHPGYYHNTCECCPCVALVDDSLAVPIKNRDHRVDVWVMEEYGKKESWTRKFSVRLPSCCIKNPSTVATFWVNDTNQLVLLRGNGQLIIFPDGNDEPARILQLELAPSDDEHRMMVDASVFRPSLIALPAIS